MKLFRRQADETTTETAEEKPAAESAARPERSSSLLRECWDDLRRRPRPTDLSEPETYTPNAGVGGPGTGGIGIDDDGIGRLRRRYESSTH